MTGQNTVPGPAAGANRTFAPAAGPSCGRQPAGSAARTTSAAALLACPRGLFIQSRIGERTGMKMTDPNRDESQEPNKQVGQLLAEAHMILPGLLMLLGL